jgi:hypothetical protein
MENYINNSIFGLPIDNVSVKNVHVRKIGTWTGDKTLGEYIDSEGRSYLVIQLRQNIWSYLKLNSETFGKEIVKYDIKMALMPAEAAVFEAAFKQVKEKSPAATRDAIVSWAVRMFLDKEFVAIQEDPRQWGEYGSKEAYEQVMKEIEEYKNKWPFYCVNCNGHGIFPGSDNNPESPGSDPCEVCTSRGICPRCFQPCLTNQDNGDQETGAGPCTFCGWNYPDSSPLEINKT